MPIIYVSSNDVSVAVRMQPLKLAVTSEVLLGGRDKTIAIEYIAVRILYQNDPDDKNSFL